MKCATTTPSACLCVSRCATGNRRPTRTSARSKRGLAATGAALIDAMKNAYPGAGLGLALDIGAKVNMGEMKW
jgi:hypothetical protein